MKRTILAALVLAAAMSTGAVVKPRVSRLAMLAMEKSFDQRIQSYDTTDPFDLLGYTRGVYLENYGAVFTAEVNLVVGPAISPFHPAPTKEQIKRLHQKKLTRLPILKHQMREALRGMAASLDTVPPNEQIVLGVSLVCFTWEIRDGLPGQILMQAERKSLLGATAVGAAIREQEF